MGVLGVSFVKLLIHSPALPQKTRRRSIVVLIVVLIYLFNCKACGKQYTGKTADHFRSRWNNYKSEAIKAESGNMENVKQKLQSHFLQPDHKGFLKGYVHYIFASLLLKSKREHLPN